MSKVTVVVGDIHGCLEEFEELLKVIEYNSDLMRLISLGDLMDRGPYPVGCVRKVREMGIECIQGNHENKHIRWRKHESKRLETGKPNPMKYMSEEERKANEALTDQDLTWLKSLPLKLYLGGHLWAVHAGCEPRYTLDKQSSSQIMRVRYVDPNGIGKGLNPDKSQPEGTVYWTEQWQGPESIIYGHCVHDLDKVRWDKPADDVHCLGIDTGCCFGGHLTAAILDPEKIDDVQFVQVKAKQKYFVGYGDD